MEKLLINNIVVSWLRLQWAEYRLILHMGQDEKGMPVVEFWEKRLNVAQHRFLRACETLEKIRKLSAKNPTLQVNIADSKRAASKYCRRHSKKINYLLSTLIK